MNELYLVQSEYMYPNYAYSCVEPIAVTDNYEYAKSLCEKVVDEGMSEGAIPQGGKWNEPFHDGFVYDDDEGIHIQVYVCVVDFKNK